MNTIFERPTLNRKTADENIAIVDRWIADTVDKLNVLKVPEGSGGGEDVPTKLSELQDDSGHRTVTDTEKATWNNKASKSQVNTLENNIGDLTDLETQDKDNLVDAINELAQSDNSSWGHITGDIGDQTDLQDALDDKANLNSPTFTGYPKAPTAAAGTNNTQIATTAFVHGKTSGLQDQIGDLSDLETQDKSDLVNAINEVAQGGDYYGPSDTAETAIDDADYFPFYDTSASGKRKTLWSNIKAKLKTFFDAIYQAKLTFDEYPRKTSGNPVRSRGVYSSVEGTEILVDDTLGYIKKNMLSIPSGVVSTTISGITFYVDRNAEGECIGIIVSGTATSDVSFSLTGATSIEMPVGDFTFSGCPEGGSLGTFSMRVVDSYGGYLSDTGAGCSFHVDEWDLDTNYGFEIFIKNGTNMDTGTMDSYVFYPMIRKAEIISDKFFPHTNSTGTDNTKVAKAGDSMTGPLTFDKVTNAIRYTGTKATYPMIKFVDNTGDAYGNGIVIGGGGLTVIGGGESADTYAAGLSGGEESLYLTNDGNVAVVTNLQSGKSSGKTFTFGSDGTFNSPSTIKQNGTAVSLSGHTHNYAGSSSAGGDANNALKLNGYASDTAATANTIARRQGNGYLFATYFNQSSGSETAGSGSYVMFCNSDGYLRKTPMSTIKSLVDTNTNTWRGFQFVQKTSGAQSIAADSVATFNFSGLNNISGYAPRIAFYQSNNSSNKVVPSNAARLCGDGQCSFVVHNQTTSSRSVTITIIVLYTQ